MSGEHKKAINYSGYREGQAPYKRMYPSKKEILEDLLILENNYDNLRLFDCSQHAYSVLELIEEKNLNFKVMLGLSLAAEINFKNHPYFYVFSEEQLKNHKKKNDLRINEMITLAHRYKDIVSAISIGNEVLSPWTNNLLTEDRLIGIAKEIQSKTDCPVTYCEEYQHWVDGLERLANQLDFISLHTYPAWRNYKIGNALEEFVKNFQQVQDKYPDKTCVITETGWPTKTHGAKIKPEDATAENQKIYTNYIQEWSRENHVLVYLFEAFDEPWKGERHPDEPEKHWGLYNVNRQKKW